MTLDWDHKLRLVNDERFWDRVEIRSPSLCWRWLATTATNGYGSIGVTVEPGKSRTVLAHRYSLWKAGRLGEGDHVDHICMLRSCVNPSHLRPVDVRTNNVENSNGLAAINLKKTHCIHGHPFSEENTWVYRGMRNCRTCYRRGRNAMRARQRSERRSRES